MSQARKPTGSQCKIISVEPVRGAIHKVVAEWENNVRTETNVLIFPEGFAAEAAKEKEERAPAPQ